MPRAILGSATAVGVLVAASLLNAQQQAQFLMPMFDEKGAPVATFSPSDLAIFEDGKPVKVLKVEPKIIPAASTGELTVRMLKTPGADQSCLPVRGSRAKIPSTVLNEISSSWPASFLRMQGTV